MKVHKLEFLNLWKHRLLWFFIWGIQMQYFFSASPTSAVQWALILQAMGSGNCITGLKAETVSGVWLVVKDLPRLGTSSATATKPRGLWVLPDKLACLYWWRWLITASGELWAIKLFLIESSHSATVCTRTNARAHSHSPPQRSCRCKTHIREWHAQI